MKTILQSNSPIAQAGKFRHRIQIVKPSGVQDSMGAWNTSQDVVVATVWATIEALTGVEKFAAHEFATEVSHAIFIRDPRGLVTGGITAQMQIWFKARTFQIEAVLNPDERRRVLQILCVEINDSRNQLNSPLVGGG